MKNFLTITFLFIAGLAFAQPVRTTITDDGVNVTVQTPVNVKVIPICDFHWVFVDGQLKMWIEGGNELIPGGRLGNFTVNGATTQASKLAALGSISDQCSAGVGSAPNYDVYVASLAQSGTSNPVPTVFENTLGGTIVWTRLNDGEYRGTLVGAFTAGRVWYISSINGAGGSSFASFSRMNELSAPDAINLDIFDDTWVPTDLIDMVVMVEIRVYP